MQDHPLEELDVDYVVLLVSKNLETTNLNKSLESQVLKSLNPTRMLLTLNSFVLYIQSHNQHTTKIPSLTILGVFK